MAPLTLTMPTATTVQIVRTFTAPLPLVWRAFTEPALVRQWLTGPPGHTMPECEIDFRVGGSWRYLWQMPDGQMEGKGLFKEIVHHQRYVSTESFDIAPEMESLAETHFTAQSDQTAVTMLMHYTSEEARDASIQHGMDEMMELSFNHLDGVLASRN